MNQIYTRATLGQREAEVFRLLGDGKTISEIAAKLKISLKTVKQYCARLKKRLDAAKFNQLLRIAVLWCAGISEIVVRGVRGNEEIYQESFSDNCKPSRWAIALQLAHKR